MTYAILDINDYQLSLQYQQQQVTQSGCALVQQQQVGFGNIAYQQRKLFPTYCFVHYWHHLSYEPIVCKHDKIRHCADLAFLQLQDLFAQVEPFEQLVVLVPPHYGQQQLALLLGLLNACQRQVIALVSQPLVYGLSYQRVLNHEADKICVVDVQLHQINLTHLSCQSLPTNAEQMQISVVNTETIKEHGVLQLNKFLAQWLHRQMIKQCRFDAFHSAQTEQALYNQISQFFSARSNKYSIILEQIQLIISQEEVDQQLALFFNGLFERSKPLAQVLIFPRLSTFLASQHHVSEQPELALTEVIERFESQLFHVSNAHDDATPLLSSLILPRVGQTRVAKQRTQASHIVYNGVAYPLSAPVYLFNVNKQAIGLKNRSAKAILFVQQEQLKLSVFAALTCRVNEQEVTGDLSLFAGDVITDNATEQQLTLIQVVAEVDA